MIGIFAGGSKNEPQKVGTNTDSQAEAKTTESEVKTYKVGDQIQVGDTIFTVNSFRNDAGTQYIKPKEGNTYVIVNASIENKGKEKAHVSTMLQMYLKDSEGTKYNNTIGPETNGSLDGEIVAGDKTKGEVAFEVPTTATGLKFYFQPTWMNGTTIVVDLE